MRRMDMVMLTLLNAQERTEAEFRELFKAAGDGFVFKVRPDTSPGRELGLWGAVAETGTDISR